MWSVELPAVRGRVAVQGSLMRNLGDLASSLLHAVQMLWPGVTAPNALQNGFSHRADWDLSPSVVRSKVAQCW